MNKRSFRWFLLVFICLVAIAVIPGESIVVRAEGSSPAEQVQGAWRNALQAGSYRYISDSVQTYIPQAVPEMIGEQDTSLDLAIDGTVVLPDQAYTEMQVMGDQRSDSVVILVDGEQSFMLVDGELKPVRNDLSLTSQSNDLLGYLAAADQVTQLDPPEGHPELVRYGFLINGPSYAEYVRQKAEANLQAQPGAPENLIVQPIKMLEKITGQGELWVNQAGFPVRQVLDLEIPEVNAQYSAHVRMSADFSAYGKVESLPRAVQGADGTWQLQGEVKAESSLNLGDFPGFGQLVDQAATDQPTTPAKFENWWSSLKSKLPIQVSPSAVLQFLAILLALSFILYYRRNPKRCYAIIVFALIPIMVFSPILQSAGVVRFMERQAQAAEASVQALPDLLKGLGFSDQEIEAATANHGPAAQEGTDTNDTDPTPVPENSQPELNTTAPTAPDGSIVEQNATSNTAMCGQGTPGVDTDSDGLEDTVEYCLGTNPNRADTDLDGINDKLENDGFDWSNQHWDSDPTNPDTNSDGLSDLLEWPATIIKYGQTITTGGQAANEDYDNDGIPNLWDEDNDDDGVPDAQDLSPFAASDFTNRARLSTLPDDSSYYEFIEIQVRPEEPTHLRYTNTALDWPDDDHQGNVKDLDDSKEDLRLVPYLIVTTNVEPDLTLGEKYGFRSWLNDDGMYIVMASLAPVQEMGAVHSFYTKVAYAPGQSTAIEWDAQMVWLAQMQNDYREDWLVKTEARTLHEYQDDFRITGLQVTKDEGYEAAVFATPYKQDDLDLFKLLIGLNDFTSHHLVYGQSDGETALEAMARNYTSGTYPGVDVLAREVVVAGPILYGHMDAGLGGLGSEVIPGLLQNNLYKQYYENGRCNDADGNLVNCASLVIAYESKLGATDLSDQLRGPSGTIDPTLLSVNLSDVKPVVTRGKQMNVYEQSISGWQMISAARMLELMEQRYHDNYATALIALYPELGVDDVRFITYAAYMWAISPSYNVISIDGQIIVPERATAEELAENWLTAEEKAAGFNAVAFWGISTGVANALNLAIKDLILFGTKVQKLMEFSHAYESRIYKWLWEGGETPSHYDKIGITGATLLAISAAASMVMGIFNSICAFGQNLGVCQNEKALMVANVAVKSIAMVAQFWKAAELTAKWINGVLQPLTAVAKCAVVVGAVISIITTWVMFGLTVFQNGGAWTPAVANALVNAIVMTVYIIVMTLINCIPVVGQIIAAVMAVLDAICYIFTLIFGGTGMTFMQAILKLFYDAQLCVDFAKDSEDNILITYGGYSTSLENESLGMVGGNKLIVSSPFDGYLQTTEYGNSDDLKGSFVEGTLSAFYDYYDDEEKAMIFDSQDQHSESSCNTEDNIKHCSNFAVLRYTLTPKINGIVPVQAVTNYTIDWAAFGFGGYVRWGKSTHWIDGVLPEDANIIKPTFMYLDVLPSTVGELWSWTELNNYDPDGDGLTNEQETNLNTNPTDWDSDDDSISDGYEVKIGTNPLNPDTDGDELDDDMEIRLGTNPTQADNNGDGLLDGLGIRHFDRISGTVVSGWQVTINGMPYMVSGNPKEQDADGDSLNDYEEKVNGLSPNAPNALVPLLDLEVNPLEAAPGELAGAYWGPGQNVEINISLMNGSPDPVTSTLSLSLPAFLENVQVGNIEGDRIPSLATNGNQLTWSFSGEVALQTYEYVEIPITATTNSTSGNGKIELTLPFGNITLDKIINVVMDSDNPEVSILAPSSGAYLRGSDYVVGGTASDPTTWITKTEVSIVKQGNSPSFQVLESVSTLWAYGWSFSEDGVYSLEARATDRMGHVGTSVPVSVTVDNTAPSVTMTSTMVGDTVQLRGTATDNMAGVAFVRLSIDGQPWRSIPLDGTSWSYDWTVGENAQGKHVVDVRAIDRSGNQSDVIGNEIVVDGVAPASIVNAGADRDAPPAVKPNTSFDISGVANEGGHLPPPTTPVELQTGMDVFYDSPLWLGVSSIHDNDGGVLATWIGDFNADRLADLAVGLPGPDYDAGQVAILYGRAGGWPTLPDLEMLGTSRTRFSGIPGAGLGSYLAAAGDTNRDNFSDILIGERNSTRAFLVFGNPGSLGNVTLEAGKNSYRTLLQTSTNIEGLSSAGDINGDGYDDLLIQAGGSGYLIFGRVNPWPEVIEVEAEAGTTRTFNNITGALGVDDVNGDQLAEWVTMKSGSITLYSWNPDTGMANVVSNRSTTDTEPRAVSLGDVDSDGKADWLYANGTDRILVYGSGSTHTFSGYDGFFVAPGDVDGDGKADLLLTTSAGVASLVQGGSLTVIATVNGVGGAANAPYTSGADLNSDGSDDLLLIPNPEAAAEHGFDAPNFSSGFISPQSLPLGASTAIQIEKPANSSANAMRGQVYSSTGADTLYVDDDAVNNSCDGHSPCYTTIQAAVTASDGGGDTIIVYPGTYAAFNVPADIKNNKLTIKGVSADAVFIDGNSTGSAIIVAADDVHLSNLTVRNATNGILLQDGAGEAPVGSGNETSVDHMLSHSVEKSISMSGGAALSLSDSTLVGNGSTAPLYVDTELSSIYSWNSDDKMTSPIRENGAMVRAGSALYALPGGNNSNIYKATQGSNGDLSSWSNVFSLKQPLSPVTNTTNGIQGKNLLAGSSTALWQLHSSLQWPAYGNLANGSIRAVAVHPTTGEIYVGGDFTNIGGVDAFHIARWDGDSWERVGNPTYPADNGVDGPVYALKFVLGESGQTYYDLYIGGTFSHYGYDPATQTRYPAGNIVRWRSPYNIWLPVGLVGSSSGHPSNGVNGLVKAIADDNGYRVFIGGSFTEAYYGANVIAANNLVRFDNKMTGEVTNIGNINGTVTSLSMVGYFNSGNLYVGGSFSNAGGVTANNVARCQFTGTYTRQWMALGSGLSSGALDMAVDAQGHLDVVTGSTNGISEWNGSSWANLGTGSHYMNVITVDTQGDVYTAGDDGYMYIQRGGLGNFVLVGNSIPFSGGSWSYAVSDIVSKDGQLYAVSEGYSYNSARFYGGLEHWTPGNFYKLLLSGGGWSQQPYPPTATLQVPIEALADDQNGNLYAIWGSESSGVLYYYNGTTWTQKANPDTTLTLKYLVWADGKLYAVGYTFLGSWAFRQYDPGTNTWTTLANPPIATGTAAAGFSWSWDGADHIYLLRGDRTSDYSRYTISTNAWEGLPASPMTWTAPTAQVADGNGNYYAIWGSYANGVLYYYNATAHTWTKKANPDSSLYLKHLIWANGKLYAVGSYIGGGNWEIWQFRIYDPGTNSWGQWENNFTPSPDAYISGVWDGSDHIYLLCDTRSDYPFRRYTISTKTWSTISFPSGEYQQPNSITADSSGNLYAIWGYAGGGLYSYNGSTWTKKTYTPTTYDFRHLSWTNNALYALAYDSPTWYFLRFDNSTNTWNRLASPIISTKETIASLSANISGYIYMMRDNGNGNFERYAIGTNTWEPLDPPYNRAMVRIGSYLYVYSTPAVGTTSDLFRYGNLPASDQRLAVDRTVFVIPDTASSLAWTNLASTTGQQFFLTDIDNSNAWVGPSSAAWSPSLPVDYPRLTWAQADFAAPNDGLFRLGPDSLLTAGYHQYKAVAHVFTSQAACNECTSGSLTWGVDAFATIRQAVESGAARVLVHAGRYPQSFYLVSGVEVVGAGAENTIIEPPASTATTLVTAEGAAGAFLSRLTLVGTSGWTGFLAEGGTKGLRLARMIIRDFSTGIILKDGSEVEVVNDTLVRNGKGLEAVDNNPVNVRNTIFAYNTDTALTHGATPTSLSNTYNDFWSNATDMNPSEVSLGSLFVDPRLRNLSGNDLRLGANSPLINMGAPSDPTVPGGGNRVDLGYAEYNAAGFYVSQGYSEFSLNDGLVWGVDAFDSIQPALNAAYSSINGLQGALPEGGYSVGVDAGTYTENLSVPSHVRLVGSGAEVTTIDAGAAGSAVTFDGVTNSELSGFTLTNASTSGAGVELKGSSSQILVARNVIRNNASDGIRLAGQSSADVLFNTIVSNVSGVSCGGSGTWANASSNILDGNLTGLLAENGALIRNSYNLFNNPTNTSGVTTGEGTLIDNPAFEASTYYVPNASSPAIDAANPFAAVPLAGGLRADLGYKELIASPLTLFFGPEIASTVTGNSGVAKLEIGIVPIADATQPFTQTLPTTWESLTPSQADQPLYYWTYSESQATSGLYRVYTRATDAAGNTEANEFDWYEGSFVVDDIAPTLSWIKPIPASTNAAAVLAAVNASGTVNTENGERSDVAQVYFSVTGPSGTVTYPAEAGQAWIQLPVTGSYTISAIAVDEAGNQASISTSLNVSATTSVTTVIYYAAISEMYATQVILRGYVRFTSAGSGAVYVRVNGGTAQAATLESTGTQYSAWSILVSLPANTSIQTITVTPRLNGIDGTVETLDKTAPSLVVTSPAAGTTVIETLTFSGTASDSGSGLARVEISLDGGYTWSQAAITGNTWSMDWSPEPGQDYVTYPAQIRAVDASGNITLVERLVTVDNLPPNGLTPLVFSPPVGEHMEKGSTITILWNSPLDAGGPVQVLMDANQLLPEVQGVDTVPVTTRSGTSATATLDAVGEWYVHIMTQDAIGNQYLTHYGPWYVGDTTASTLSNRQKSIIIDGNLDLANHEWKANELLGEDARSGHNQELYTTWDGQHVYLGWSGAWWTLDGTLWAYLDTVENSGATITTDGSALPENLYADRAVEISGPEDGALWTWDGSTWVEGSLDQLDFANGPSGDTEVRVDWTPSSSQKLNLVAFALPQEISVVQSAQNLPQATEGMQGSIEEQNLLQQEPEINSWAVFPTTNSLLELNQDFEWTNVGTVSDINSSQPSARTVHMSVSSPQASGTAWGTANLLEYVIELTNPELTDISGLTLNLAATTGLSYISQSGATCTSCTNSQAWTLSVSTLAAGEAKTILVNARTNSSLAGIQKVTSTFNLKAGTTSLTPESQITSTISHRVDGQAPTASIDALGGSAIASGSWTFTGTAEDGAADGGPGSGVAYVEVSLNGGPWKLTTGTQAWSITLPVSGSSVILQARAKDYAGLVSSIVSHTFYTDTTPPTVTWTLPAMINAIASITGSTQDQGPTGSQVRSVEIQVGKSDGWTSGWSLANLLPLKSGTRNWIWIWPQSDDSVTYTMRVRATDEVGNVTITAWQSTLVDNMAPRITLSQQETLVMLPGPATLLAGSIAENGKLYSFDIQVYGPLGFYSVVKYNVDKLVNWTYAPDLSGWKAGTYKLRLTARDVNNNTRLLGPFVLIAKDTSITSLTASNDGPRRVNEVITFTASIATGSNVTYAWDFGDGSKGSGKVVTHAYTQMAYYTAQVVASNPINSMTAKTIVNVGPPMQSGPVFTVNSTAGTNDHRCDVDSCTLREAIEAANNDNLDSTIELSASTYTLSEVDNVDSADNSANLLPPISTNITINGHGAHLVRASTAPSARFFDSWGQLTLNEVWLQGGKVGLALMQSGGAILNYGTLIVKNSYLDNNEASGGAAIYNGGTLYLYNSTIWNNISTYGAVSGHGSFYLYSNTFLNNQGTTTSVIHLNSVWYSAWGFYNNFFGTSVATGPLCNLGAYNIPMAGNLATDSSCTGFGTTTIAALKLTRGYPASEGGPTPSVSINTGSSLIDKGNNTSCQIAAIEGRDQRNYKRTVDGNGDGVAVCDVGSFEYGSTVKPPAGDEDTTPPQVRIALTPTDPDGTNGWYRNPVTVTPQFRDMDSEVIGLRCALDPQVEPASYDELADELCPFVGGAPVETDGLHNFYLAAMDLYGNQSEVVKASFQIDATPPVITCPEVGPILLGSGEKVIGPAGVDASVSGLDEAAANLLTGSFTTESIGPRVLTFAAFDLAGNAASQECSYNVVYDFGGFYPPLDPAPAFNTAQAGKAIAVKFSLAGDQGLEILTEGFPTSQQADPETLELLGEPTPADTTGKRELTYDEKTGWYNYVWKTDKAWAGTSRVFILQLIDGTQHLVYFNFQ